MRNAILAGTVCEKGSCTCKRLQATIRSTRPKDSAENKGRVAHLLREVDKLSNGEISIEECVIAVGDNNGNGIGISGAEVPSNHVARILNPV